MKNRKLKPGFYFYTPDKYHYPDGVILYVEDRALYGLHETKWTWDKFPHPIEVFEDETLDEPNQELLYLGR